MGNDYTTINAKGDVSYAKDQAYSQINKVITESKNISGNLEDKLKDLSDAVNEMIKEMPKEQADEVTDNLQKLTEEASKDKPKKRWYEFSGQGLIDAAKTVGAIGDPVIQSTKAVLSLLK